MRALKQLAAALALAALSIAADARPLSIVPTDTDRRISEANEPHLALLPEGQPRNELLVFLPGTGGTPEKGLFHPFTELAASLGYHVVMLAYPDDVAAQQACGKNRDPECHVHFRNAVLTGGRGPRIEIARADSIESRLEALLHFLDAKMPNRGWGQFLNRDGIQWRRIAVAGQSQGGGHSYMIGKNHEVARVIMFGSPKDYSFRYHEPARGFDSNTRTPLKRFFAYNHARDDGHGCSHAQQQEILRQIGLMALGVADVDRAAPPFGHAHVLYTDADVASGKFHGAPLRKDLSANPIAWKYLLTEPAP